MHDREEVRDAQPLAARPGREAHMLSNAGQRLLRAAVDSTAEHVTAELAVEWFGGCCLLHVLEQGGIRLAAVASSEDVPHGLVRDLRIRLAEDGSVERVIRSGRSTTIALTDAGSEASGEDPQNGSSAAPLRPTTGRIIAIRHAGSGVLGSLCIARNTGESASSDPPVAEALADLAGEAIAAQRWIDERSAGHQPWLDEHLIAEFAHELRSPIAAIIGYCDLFEGGRTDLASLFFKRILTAARYQMNLIDQLALLGHPGSAQPTHLELTDLRDTVRMAADAFTTNSIQVRLDVPAAPVICRTEPVRMRHVLVNLLINAADTANGNAVALTLSTRDNEAILQVTGLGTGDEPGLDESERPADINRPGNHRSSLNLAIAERLVTLLNGAISVRTKAGEATTLIVRVPLEASGAELTTTLASTERTD